MLVLTLLQGLWNINCPLLRAVCCCTLQADGNNTPTVQQQQQQQQGSRRYVCGLREVLKAVKSGRACAVLVAPDIQQQQQQQQQHSLYASHGSGFDAASVAAALGLGGGELGLQLLPGAGGRTAPRPTAGSSSGKQQVPLADQVDELLTACARASTRDAAAAAAASTPGGVPVVFALSRKRLGQVFSVRKRMSAIALLDVSGVEDAYGRVLALAASAAAAWQARQHNGGGGSGVGRTVGGLRG